MCIIKMQIESFRNMRMLLISGFREFMIDLETIVFGRQISRIRRLESAGGSSISNLTPQREVERAR